jgi:hypothetical protein
VREGDDISMSRSAMMCTNRDKKNIRNECDVRKDERVRMNERERERRWNTRELRNKNKSDLLRWKRKKDN